jgi:DNA-binding winged helix-turn-helix (wHTH) protein
MAKENSKKNQSAAESAYRFGPFELNPAERMLTRVGAPVALSPKMFDALLHMVRMAGRLVSKRELMDTLWPSTFVSEANPTNIIGALRRVLGQDAICTVSKYGYRLTTQVHGEPGITLEVYENFARGKELIAERSPCRRTTSGPPKPTSTA